MADTAGTEAAIDDLRNAATRLIAGPRVSDATRVVLTARMVATPKTAPRFFSAEDFADLRTVCARILPPDSPVAADRVASTIDRRLADGDGPGWRYDAMPPDGEAYRLGLAWLREGAGADTDDGRLLDVSVASLDGLLERASRGRPRAPGFDAKRWFEQLAVDVVEAHVAHPVTQLQMGCSAFADVDPGDPIVPVPAAIDAQPMKRFADEDVVDAVVIGTGAGGAPLLWRLARAGLSAVALEAGRRWNPATDFATDEQAQHKLFWTDERLSAGADPIAFGNNNSGLGVGGSTLHFTAYTPRPQPDDFRLASDFGVGVDWPIGYADLEPYFDELEAIVGVAGPAHYPWGPARKSGYPMEPLPLNAAAEAMRRGADALGIATSPAPNAALSRPYRSLDQPTRHACTQRGFCQAGCSTGAKGSVDVVFIPPAIAHGAEVRSEVFATRIERDAAGRVSGVIYVRDGVEHRQRCRNVFLCAGAIETPRLLLMDDSVAGGLANASGQVGRNFMAHCGLQRWGFFDEPTDPWRGIPGGLISEELHRPRDADFAGGYLLQSIGVMPVTYASQLARSDHRLFGAALGRHLARYDHVAGVNILGECLPSESNRMELSDERDRRGLPKPRVHFSAGANEERMSAHARRTLHDVWSAAGAKDAWDFQRFAHVIGTCRMGAGRETAVVDTDGRSFDVPGLYVCDNSIFPSALSVNPALTIMALSLRIADRFIANRNRS